MPENDFTILILAGEIHNRENLLDHASRAAHIVAADGGAEHACLLGLKLDAIVGDLDSVSKETCKFYEEQDPPCEIVLVPEQDHNDLEKSLIYLLKIGSGEVRIFGITGGRTDHTLSNLSVMLRYAGRFQKLIAYDESGYHFFVEGQKACRFDCPVGTTISLTPFGKASGIVTTNLRFPLSNETLEQGIREGLSNEALGSPVTIVIEAGALLVSVLT